MTSKSTTIVKASAGRLKSRAPGRRPDGNAPEAAAQNGRTHRRSAEIIDAAAHVFAERGYHGATTQDIADLLGIRQASLYYYFSSKEAALELVCLKGVEGFFEAAKIIAARPESARKRLTSLINSHLTPLVDRADFV